MGEMGGPRVAAAYLSSVVQRRQSMRGHLVLIVVLFILLALPPGADAQRADVRTGPGPSVTTRDFVPGQVLVRYRSNLASGEREQTLQRVGARELKSNPRSGYVKL